MKKTLVSLVISFVVSANAFAESKWECKSYDVGADVGTTVIYSELTNSAILAEVTYAGTSHVELTCGVAPELLGNDLSTSISCSDGLLEDSKKVEFQLGGLLPNLGTAGLYYYGPKDYTLFTELHCRAK